MLVLDGSILLIHHWDTDGLCSASLILDALGRMDVETWTPFLGTFSLTKEDITWAQNFDIVLICDMALPARNVEEIAEKTRVIMFDHHHQEPIDGIKHMNT